MKLQTPTIEKLVTVTLSGKLGATFGRTFTLSVSSVREVIRALGSQLEGFQKFLTSSESRGLTYAVFNGKRNINQDEFQLNGVQDEIRIVPVIIGSKKAGMFQTILGAVMVAAGAVLSFTPAAAASPFLFKMGAVMMLGGIAQMLSPQGTPGTTNTQDTRKSYSFGSPANTGAAGNPVPAFWGKRLIGGPIISGGIFVEEQS